MLCQSKRFGEIRVVLIVQQHFLETVRLGEPKKVRLLLFDQRL